jgi:uncharacterized membrane protein YgcG
VIRNTTVLNTRSYNNYAYAHNTAAVTAASRNAFVGGQSINRGANHITSASLRGAEVMNRNSFAPTRASSFGATHMTARATPSAAVQNRSVMARTAPAAAASHQPVQSMNGNFTATRTNGNYANRGAQTQGSYNSSRQTQLSQSRPQTANSPATSNRAGNNGRTWEAQGNTSDRGNAPQGFGSNTRYNNGAVNSARARTDRPPWAGSSNSANGAGRANSSVQSSRGYETYTGRSNESQSRSYSSPRSSYPSQRSYSEPSRSYSPPARSSAPAPSHSSGGSAPHSSGGGGSPHGGGGGGGGSHGGGGGHGGGHH